METCCEIIDLYDVHVNALLREEDAIWECIKREKDKSELKYLYEVIYELRLERKRIAAFYHRIII